jgi:hypothetical protein
MQINISPGEALDRLSILEIKERRIAVPAKLDAIRTEKAAYAGVQHTTNTVLYKLLVYVNTRIWDITEVIKSLKPSDATYAPLSHQIFEYNQMRFRLKSGINTVAQATVREQKSYAETHIVLQTADPVDIAYCFLYYDHVTVESHYPHPLCTMMGIPVRTPTRDADIPSRDTTSADYAAISEIVNPMFPPISYISGGLLGDFLHQLSVVCENFCTYGKKGILYISNAVGDLFTYGLERAYNDLKPLIMSQPYIQEFAIYKGEPVHVNLSKWRNGPHLYRMNWFTMFQQEFGVSLGRFPWLAYGQSDSRFAGKTVISTSSRRFPSEYKGLGAIIDISNTVFVAFDTSDYDFFVAKTGIHIPVHVCGSLEDMVSVIRGCKHFIGNLSSPLAIAYSLHKSCHVLLSNSSDDIHVHNLSEKLPFISFLAP